MLVRIPKHNYILVKSDADKRVRIKGQKTTYSEGTEKIGQPKEYEEVEE